MDPARSSELGNEGSVFTEVVVAEMRIIGVGAVEDVKGLTVLEACETHGFPMEAECGGFAACNSCRVSVASGMNHLSSVLDEERGFLDNPSHRLGCQAIIQGDVVLKLAPGT